MLQHYCYFKNLLMNKPCKHKQLQDLILSGSPTCLKVTSKSGLGNLNGPHHTPDKCSLGHPSFPHYEIYANMSQASARPHQAPGKCPTTSISIKPHNNLFTNIMSKVKQMSTRCMKRKFMLLSSGHSPSFWLSPLSQVLSSLEVTLFEFTENLKNWVLEKYLPYFCWSF